MITINLTTSAGVTFKANRVTGSQYRLVYDKDKRYQLIECDEKATTTTILPMEAFRFEKQVLARIGKLKLKEVDSTEAVEDDNRSGFKNNIG